MKLSILSTFLLIITCAFIHAQETPLAGHSHQGEAFNEGPRQATPLFKGNGNVNFPITTSWNQGQAYFNQGMGQLHGFWYYEAERSFRQITAHDPDCAIAYWGMAMANIENKKRATAFIKKAEPLIKKSSPRETLYISAYAKYYNGKEKDAKKNQQKLINDLEEIILAHPDDIEAKAILAVTMWQFSRKGMPITSHAAVDALLQQVFAKSPLHPAHHYRIHLWDKRKASQALDSAAVLGSTGPSIAHMWHMPGHIYSKLHRYQDAAWHQQASARIDHAHMAKHGLLPDQIHNYAHNNEWLARNWINLGNASSSLAMAKSLLANPRHPKLNTIKGKAHSYRYGRDRLIETLEKFELWEDALRYANSQWLTEVENPKHERPRLRLIGLAQFHLGQKEPLAQTIEKLSKLLPLAEATHKEKKDAAQVKAKTDKTPEKEAKKIIADIDKEHTALIKKIKHTQAELKGELAALNGDKDAAIKALGKSGRPHYARALRYLELGDTKQALSISKKTPENQALPLAARIEILHQLGQQDEAIKAFEQLRKNSSQLDLNVAPFKRLIPIAKTKAYNLPENWKIAYHAPADFGTRPALDSLGPIHWTPPFAPLFTLPNQENQAISLNNYQGKPLLLIFYLGHGCLHCVDQLNAIAKHTDDFKKANIPILAISSDTLDGLKKSQENYDESDKKKGFPFPLVADPENEIFRLYGAYDDFEKETLHGTFLISPEGRILWSDISADPFMDTEFLLKEAQRLLPLHEK